ncbi:AMP-binding protein [Rhodococcus wratislaviensis]|uniref:Putative fatty-acid--CoA ligase n=1 Tax=Rhodococcus wratislaviensis NBRC 100605 TaxID=1219028 RepID=X0Q488_RHOWR|nr:AMP-binding protein [Rhodococcus wratislaviensis]GAF45306.1 putative fatty-acid--CoA ligase [Rhodococcus wratislaviensis NBRC 100605]
MNLSIWQIFRALADAHPQLEAVIDHQRRFTYRDLGERATRLANVLTEHGLGTRVPRSELNPWELGQDTVALLMHNGVEYAESLLAASASRVASMNVNYAYTPAEMEYVLNDGGAAAVVYHARLAPVLAEVLPRLRREPLLIQVADDSHTPLLPGALDYEETLSDSSTRLRATEHSGDDIQMIYTGGTTGMPKAVLWRQDDVWSACLARGDHRYGTTIDELVAYVGSRERGKIVVCVPMMHGSGAFQTFSGLVYGDTLVYTGEQGHFRADDVLDTIARERVTSLLMIGEAYAKPLVAELATGRHDISSLRLVLSGGAPITQRSKQALTAALKPAAFIELMAASETGSALERHDATGADLPNGVFRPRRGAGVSVLDVTRTHKLEAGHSEPGYLAKAGSLPLGYLGDQAKTEATFTTLDGQRYSVPGDLARLRADGLVELLGRDSATINTGGEKVFAEEVEEALTMHPSVADAAVAGRPSERWGQEVTAIVEIAAGIEITDEEIKAAAAESIARYKLPKKIIRVDRVQRTANGKIDRPWAKKVAADGLL